MDKKVRFYSLYERLWHWVQAAAVVILIITGFAISYSSWFPMIGFRTAVDLHNLAAAVLIVNAFLALFYNVAGGLIKRYIPGSEEIFSKSLVHATYYIWGIFTGEPHPFDKTPEKRLFPLQKITYFMVLNVLLPLMVVTGFLKISAEFNPAIIEMFGGLKVIGPVHRFGAWLFTAFLIVHVYMTTTGTTVFSNIVSMITGYGEIESASEEEIKNG